MTDPGPPAARAPGKVVIVNGWSDDNRGDGAILTATVSAMKRSWPSADIYVVSRFGWDDVRFVRGYRHFQTDHPDVRVVADLFPTTAPGLSERAQLTGWIRHRLALLFYLVRNLLLLVVPSRTLLDARDRETLGHLARADLVVSKGGQFLHAKPGIRGFLSVLQQGYMLILAARLDRPYAIHAQSFVGGRGMGNLVLRALLDRSCALTVRESESVETLRQVGVRAPDAVVPDAAFGIEPRTTDRVRQLGAELRQKAETRRIVFVTVRPWFYDRTSFDSGRYNHYLSAMAATIDDWQAAGEMAVVLVAQCWGPGQGEDDRIAVRDLIKRLKEPPLATVTEIDLSPAELCALYSFGDVLVGTRFHSVILAMVAGTPAVAVSYLGPKATGIMADLGAAELVMAIEAVSSDMLHEALEIAERRGSLAGVSVAAQDALAAPALIWTLCRGPER